MDETRVQAAASPASPREQRSTMDALLQAEAEQLLLDRNDPASPYFSGDSRARVDRRRFLLGSIAAVGATSALPPSAHGAVPLGAVEREVPSDASRVQGFGLDDESYGSRSQFETEVRTRFKTATPQSSWTFTPLQKSVG